jgi:hypothetical protein
MAGNGDRTTSTSPTALAPPLHLASQGNDVGSRRLKNFGENINQWGVALAEGAQIIYNSL